MQESRHHRGGTPTGKRLKIGDLARELDERRQHLLAVAILAGQVLLIALDIDAQSRSFGSGSREAVNDAGATFEENSDALVLRDRAVDRILIGEIVGSNYFVLAAALPF